MNTLDSIPLRACVHKCLRMHRWTEFADAIVHELIERQRQVEIRLKLRLMVLKNSIKGRPGILLNSNSDGVPSQQTQHPALLLVSTMSTYPIVGIKTGLGPDGSRPLRYDIRQFADPSHNKYARIQLNMFLLALEMIQAMSREELLSWFQIGGTCS